MRKGKIWVFVISVVFFIFADARLADLKLQSFFDGKVQLKIPREFKPMSEAVMKLKYPMERRPTVVLTDETTQINVALNWTQNRLSQELIEEYQKSFVETFENMYPAATWKGKGVKKSGSRKFGFLELITPAMDTRIYNLLFFTDLDGRLLLFTFNCTIKNMTDWLPIAKDIMDSVVIK
jgi:hypothetical protein